LVTSDNIYDDLKKCKNATVFAKKFAKNIFCKLLDMGFEWEYNAM